jgi:hypothetical protein
MMPLIAKIMYCQWQMNELWVQGTGEMILADENQGTRWKTCPGTTLSVTKITWTGLGSNWASAVRGWRQIT